jgi:uncharacterized protein
MVDWSIAPGALSTQELAKRKAAFMFIYLHGFNSSPASFKAQALARRLAERGYEERFSAPVLPHWPKDAVATAEGLIARHSDNAVLTLVGSSLGGYYATWLAERHALRAVLVNPAIHPYELMASHLGEQTNLYTGERYRLTPEHVEQLRALDVHTITRPQRYLLVVASGDEVLDSRAAVQKFAGAEQIVQPGGDHGFADFVRYLDPVIDFGLRASAP